MKHPGLARFFRIVLTTLAIAAVMGMARADPVSGAASADDKKDPIGHIDGIEIARPNGGFLGLQILGNHFVLSFYDAKKHKVPVDVARATARWAVHYQPADEHAVLAPGSDGTSLTSPKVVRPPHDFKLFLGLFVEGSDDAVEFHTVDMHD